MVSKKIWKIINVVIAVIAIILLWVASTAFNWNISKQTAYISLGIGAVIAFFALLMLLIRSLTKKSEANKIRSDIRLKLLIRKTLVASIVFLLSLLVSIGLKLFVIEINWQETFLVTFILFIGLLFLKEYFFPSPYLSYAMPVIKPIKYSKPSKAKTKAKGKNEDINKRIHQIYSKKQVNKKNDMEYG